MDCIAENEWDLNKLNAQGSTYKICVCIQMILYWYVPYDTSTTY